MSVTSPIVKVPLTLRNGASATAVSFSNLSDGKSHLAMIYGNAARTKIPLIRIHSKCLLGDTLEVMDCDCGDELSYTRALFSQQGGILFYMDQEGRGIGQHEKIKALDLQAREKLDTYEANRRLGHADDERSYRAVPEMLRHLGVFKFFALTNNPEKVERIVRDLPSDIKLMGTVPMPTFVNDVNRPYLQAKQKHGHNLKLEP